MRKLLFILIIVADGCGEQKPTQELEPTIETEKDSVSTTEILATETEAVEDNAVLIIWEHQLEAYILDKEPGATNVRAKPNGAVLQKLPKGNAYQLALKGVFGEWFYVGSIWSPENEKGSFDNVNGYVHSSVIAVDTRNYSDHKIFLYSSPDETSTEIFTIKTETQLTLKTADESGKWLYVTLNQNGKVVSGWIQSEWVCGSVVTLCS